MTLMKNWKAMAQARDLGIPGHDLERVLKPLESLEETFRPMVKDLTPDVEPVYRFTLAGRDE